MVKHCKQMLRDRLVCGVNDERIQRRLLSEQNLTFDTALKIALSLEAADKNAQDLRNNNAAAACHKVCSKADGRVSCDEGMQASAASKSCFRCKGTNHSAPDCRFKTAKCHSCGKIGHISRACRSKGKTASRERERDSRDKKGSGHRAYKVEGSDSDDSVDTFTLGCIKEYIRKVNSKNLTKVQPYTVDMQIDGHKVKLEIDTGCSLTVLNEETFKELRKSGKSTKIKQTGIKLETYTGQPIEVKGTSQVTVEYQEQKKTLPVVVVAGNGPNLLGRGWLAELKLSWDQIKHERHVLQIQTGDDSLQKMLVRHSDVFKEELGTLRGLQAKIHISPEAVPRFFRPRSVPYAMRTKVDDELNSLQKEHVIRPVKYSEWAAPVVPILKTDGSIRLCGDYKLTVNRAASLEQYPIPRLEDLCSTLSGGKKFSKLDLSHAYQQVLVDEESQKFLTINTQRGLFTYQRLPFGVASAPAIFQRIMEGLVQGIPKVAVYLDDILITGVDRADHLENLGVVLQRLEDAGLRLKREKCVFLQDNVEYLGHRVNAHGLQPVGRKVKAIVEAPSPSNVSELKAYLGLLNYYDKFLPNLATCLAPLYELLKKGSAGSG